MSARLARPLAREAAAHAAAQTVLPVVVRAEDIDHIGHVNNAVYLQWTQSAVIAHWRRLADAEAVARYLWVALRHEITYRRPAFLGDDVAACVRLLSAAGPRARFETLIRRGDILLAQVFSDWCCIDGATRRPVRLSKPTLARFLGQA